ncbi:MAG: NAD(+)/NADH kinase [Bacilli bacterium]|nr:NAD(+)/NADH kinase [Bacilli bacterium]
MKKINKVKLFVNNNIKSRKAAKIITEVLKKKKFEIVEEDFDLGIAVGGDGSFLRMVKNSNFNSNPYYVGVNAGTLGFAQDVSLDEINKFIDNLRKDKFTYEQIGVQEVEITTNDVTSNFYSLNEIVIRDEELNTTGLDVYVDDVLLEKYTGDGLLIATSFGSTAYNLSFGGSVVYNTFDTLQITPIAPLNNKSYHSLINSVIVPSNKVVKLIPIRNKEDLVITIDGDNNFYNNVLKIETSMNQKSIKVIRKEDYNFIQKINDKFIK